MVNENTTPLLDEGTITTETEKEITGNLNLLDAVQLKSLLVKTPRGVKRQHSESNSTISLNTKNDPDHCPDPLPKSPSQKLLNLHLRNQQARKEMKY
ncbi:hypothetical protein HHI36_004863 [Cryptolaemus montrouzieri]|uniref:Uncharacterized protein n=1 Tax=Cryptolaemus montrouzieri TaxID=559131 RepID=A0ABD2NT02_9CUCU